MFSTGGEPRQAVLGAPFWLRAPGTEEEMREET